MIRFFNNMYYITNDYGEIRKFTTKEQAIIYLKYIGIQYKPTKQEIRKEKLERLKMLYN